MADAPSGPPKGLRKLALRLDNGTLIRGDGQAAEVLTPAHAMEAGLLSEAHLLKMQALLCEIHAKLPEEGPLKSISLGSKRSVDSVVEMDVQTVSAKKSRSVGGGTANGIVPAPVPSAAPSAGGVPLAAATHDWPTIARKLVQFLRSSVLQGGTAFDPAVDPNVVKDYYTYIQEPMYFNLIMSRLQNNEYESPKGFYDDILLICDNCYKYNVEVHPSEFGRTGVLMENAFLKAWAKTPMAAQVPPRPLREMPYIPPPQGVPVGGPRRAAGAGRGSLVNKRTPGAPRGGRGGRRPGRPPGSGINRSKSVNSYAPALTDAQRNRLFAALQDQDILQAHMEKVIEILQAAGEMSYDEDGDVELDVHKVTPPTLAKLYQQVCGGGAAAAVAPAPSGFTMEKDDNWGDEEDDE